MERRRTAFNVLSSTALTASGSLLHSILRDRIAPGLEKPQETP